MSPVAKSLAPQGFTARIDLPVDKFVQIFATRTRGLGPRCWRHWKCPVNRLPEAL